MTDELISSIVIDKCTGTHSDVLAAVGLADLLMGVAGLSSVTIRDTGTSFEVTPSKPITTFDIRTIPCVPGYPFVITNSKTCVPKEIADAVDYKLEKEKEDRGRELRKSSGKGKKKGMAPVMDAETVELGQHDQLREDWSLIKVLNSLQGDETSNKMAAALANLTHQEFEESVELGIRSLAKKTASTLQLPASSVQLFTPNAAKGYCRLKPDSTNRNDSTKDQWTEPFVEWLKYRGYFRVAAARFFGPKGEHVRCLCPVPADISITALAFIGSEFRKKMSTMGMPGAPKIDCLATLGLAELLIRHSEEFHRQDSEPFPGLFLVGKSPSQLISGVMITNYQSMGQSKAVSSLATLGLPGWFPITDNEDAQIWLEILGDHQQVIRALQDDHSDEIGLLITYRQFLEHRGESSTWKLIEFMSAYGSFLIRAREQKRKVRAFRTDHFRRIVMSSTPKLSSVLSDPGFIAVAGAVRKATVSAQAQKSMGQKDYREIRYELLHDLRRKRNLPGINPFIESVADFISKYNFENARRRELNMRSSKNVTTEEFESFVNLVEGFGAPVVGAMLCAYGSCREPREDDSHDNAIADELEPVATT